MSKCGDFLRKFVLHDDQHSIAISREPESNTGSHITNEKQFLHTIMMIRKNYHRICHTLILDTVQGNPNCNDLQTEIFDSILSVESYLGKNLMSQNSTDLGQTLSSAVKMFEVFKNLLMGIGRFSDIPVSVFSEYRSRSLMSNESILIHTCLVLWYQTLRLMRLLIEPITLKRNELETKLANEQSQEAEDFGASDFDSLADDLSTIDSCLSQIGPDFITDLKEILLLDLMISAWINYVPLTSYRNHLENNTFLCNCSLTLFKRLARRLIKEGPSRLLNHENLLLTLLEIVVEPSSKPSLTISDIRQFSLMPFFVPSEHESKDVTSFYMLWFLYSFSTSLNNPEERQFFATCITNCRRMVVSSLENIMASFILNLNNQGDYTRLSPHNEERLKTVLIIMMQLAPYFDYDISLLSPILDMFFAQWNNLSSSYFDPEEFMKAIDCMENGKELPATIKKLSDYSDIESFNNVPVRQRVKYSNFHRDHSIVELFAQTLNCYLRTMSSIATHDEGDRWSSLRNRFCTQFNGDSMCKINERGFVMSLAILNSFVANENYSRWIDVTKYYRDLYERLDKMDGPSNDQDARQNVPTSSSIAKPTGKINTRRMILIQTLRCLYFQCPPNSEVYFANFVERISEDIDDIVRSSLSSDYCRGGSTTHLIRSLEPLVGRQRVIEVLSRVEPNNLWTQPAL